MILKDCKGINTSLEYHFESDLNPNVNDISINDKIVNAEFQQNKNNDEISSDIEDMNKLKELISSRKNIEKTVKLKKNEIKKLFSDNNQLNEKYVETNKKFESIINDIKYKPFGETENSLKEKILNLEKEIENLNIENKNINKEFYLKKERYKLKQNLENSKLSKIEKERFKELKNDYQYLFKNNFVQIRQLTILEKDNKYNDRLIYIKEELKLLKEKIRNQNEFLYKQDKFLKFIHEKIGKYNNLKRNDVLYIKEENEIEQKSIIFEENNLKLKLNKAKEILSTFTKTHEEKIKNNENDYLKIKSELIEAEKLNKILIYKRNELKRILKMNENRNDKITNIKYNQNKNENELKLIYENT